MMLGLDIGCGDKLGAHLARREDITWIGLDKTDFSRLYPVDRFVRHDVAEPLPFPTDHFDILLTHHMLEHLPHIHPRVYTDPDYDGPTDLLVYAINEMWRVLKPGCDAHIVVPWKEHTNAWRSPSHYRYFDHSFWNVFAWQVMPDEHESWGLCSKWHIARNEVVDNCHVYAILRALQWESEDEYKGKLGSVPLLQDYEYAGFPVDGLTQ